jgi:hypothetical protein
VEDLLDCHPEVAGAQIGLVHGEIKDGVIDGAEDPAADAALRGIPLGVSGLRWSRAIDVLAHPEFAAQRLEEERHFELLGFIPM